MLSVVSTFCQNKSIKEQVLTTDTDENPKDTTSDILAEEDYEVKRDYEEDQDEPESCFYVERANRFIYEVKFFPEFALVRPAHPDYTSAVQRVPLINFVKEFEEYQGDVQMIRDYLWGAEVEGVIVEKK